MKNRLREIFKLKKEYFTPKIQDINAINQNLQHLIEFMKFEYVMAFSPLPHEVDIKDSLDWILKEKSLILPRVNSDQLEVYEVKNLEQDLEIGSFKILEPKVTCKSVNRGILNCVVVPGVCFDENGYRLGYGKGFYDKYLENFLGAKIGVCFEEFLTSNIYPQAHDVVMDFVVTEKAIYAQKK